ncbi:hypothetical protein BT96DRAFT_939905 [Gymnopus androsaceus JB14]|uniref:DUF6533 domain-containing protein n=1 Tax=Gymnopus androsaceus JB14 TaxID=1447944 RepID=A0A6A4HIU2_9AGAR|nr:hypothetical protein BT96DRAFT_939905 [Gymnopus androsaceus JB14]
MFTITSFVILVYDLLLTFPDEVELIWNVERRRKWATALWVVNRYLWPLAYIVVTVGFQDPHWGEEKCERYVLYPQYVRLVVTVAIGIYFIMRLYAIYQLNPLVLVVSIVCLCALVAVKIWAFLDGTHLKLPTGGQDYWLGDIALSAVLSFRSIHQRRSVPLLTALAREGCVYFALITIVNLTNVFLYRYARADLKDLMTSLSSLKFVQKLWLPRLAELYLIVQLWYISR